jgi:uncharacterized membrane protein YjjP (DUF1212 family)
VTNVERHRLRDRLRRAVDALLHRDEPTVSQLPKRSPYLIRTTVATEDQNHRPALRPALDFLLRLGELLLRSGAGSVDVEASLLASAAAIGLREVEASVTYTQVLVSVAGHDADAPVSDLRIVRARAVDHNRLVELHQMVLALTEGELTPAAAYRRLNAIEAAPKRYPRWSVTIAWGVLAGAIAVQLGGGPLLSMVTFCTTVLIDRFGRRLAHRHVPDFYLNFAGAAIVTSVAALLTAVELPVMPPLVVAGGVVVFLPGLALLAAVQDALTGFMVTAAARTMEVLVMAAGILGGLAVALIVARQVGVDMPMQMPPAFTLAGLPARFVSAGAVAAAMAVAFYVPLRLLPPIFLLGGSGYAAYLGVDHMLSSPSTTRAVVAVGIGVCGYAIASRRRLPALAVVLPAIIPMLPGLTIYTAMLQLTQGNSFLGISELLIAGTDSLALAAGVIFGEFLGQPLRRRLPRWERRYAGPRLVGPLRIRRGRHLTQAAPHHTPGRVPPPDEQRLDP